jgi:hypothetical protein
MLSRRRVLALARAFDRDESGTFWARGERRLKTRLARRRAGGAFYLTYAELRWIGEWKTPRIRPQIARNSPVAVRELTAAAFLARDDATRLRLLLGLRGVGMAVASVVLHFAHPTRYPIYDVRVRTALRRLDVRTRFPPTPAGWVAYVVALRALAVRYRVSLRTLDKALWRFGAD